MARYNSASRSESELVPPSKIQVKPHSIITINSSLESPNIESEDVIHSLPMDPTRGQVSNSQTRSEQTTKQGTGNVSIFKVFWKNCISKVEDSRNVVTEVHSPESSETNRSSLFVVTDVASRIRRVEEVDQKRAINGDNEVTVGSQPDRSSDNNNNRNSIRYVLQIMYYIGMTTYKPGCHENSPASLSSKGLIVLQKIFFWAIAVTALIHSLFFAKLHWLYFAMEGGITNFVDVGFRIVPILTEIYMARLFAFQHDKISTMVGRVSEIFRKGSGGDTKKGFSSKFVYAVITGLMGASVFWCVIKIFTVIGLANWSLHSLLLRMSFRFSTGLFIWRPNDLNENSTSWDLLLDEYGTNLTDTTIVMGVTGTAMRFCSILKIESLINFIIVTMWTFRNCVQIVSNNMQKTSKMREIHIEDDVTIANLNEAFEYLEQYRCLKETNKEINALLDGVLKFMHVHNIMMTAHFLMHLKDNEVSGVDFVFLIYNIVKMCFVYAVAKQSHEYNSMFQKLIRDLRKQNNDTAFLLAALTILEEMKAESIGLGAGEFIIGESFILKFIGMVGSLFMLQVDKGDGK